MLGLSHPCTFCSEEVKHRILMRQGTVNVIEDLYPVTQGHLLVIPFRHTLDYFTMQSVPERHQRPDSAGGGEFGGG